MNVLVTGAFGRVGTALIDHLSDQYTFTYLDREPDPTYDGVDADAVMKVDITSYRDVADAVAGHDAVVHLAACPDVDADWPTVFQSNIQGMQHVMQAVHDHAVDTVVFSSSNHVVGMYEQEHAPGIYAADSDVMLDHTVPIRPDSYYGCSKAFGEHLGRFFTEQYTHPTRFYALRIGSVRHPTYDHPYGDAEQGVDAGTWERDSAEYRDAVIRMRATWQSRRDVAHMIQCCLADTTVTFDIFYGVSDNDHRFWDISHAQDVIGYAPINNAAAYNAPP